MATSVGLSVDSCWPMMANQVATNSQFTSIKLQNQTPSIIKYYQKIYSQNKQITKIKKNISSLKFDDR